MLHFLPLDGLRHVGSATIFTTSFETAVRQDVTESGTLPVEVATDILPDHRRPACRQGRTGVRDGR